VTLGVAQPAVVLLLLLPGYGQAQATVPDAYLDPGAGELHRAASEAWWAIDESVVRYTARVQQRIAAQIRTPLKDRTIYRNESAARVFWDRDYDDFIQVLGARSQYPGREYEDAVGFLDDLTIEEAFDPGGDRLVFGFADQEDAADQDQDDFWVAHPLAPGADSLYQYRSGDTLVISIPARPELRVVELEVLPRIADVHRIQGSLWIEPESGALVRAVYRLSRQFDAIRDIPDLQQEDEEGNFKYVPGFFKPWTFDMELVAIEYSLWNFEVWLPRSMRMEGRAAAGILKFPVSMDLAYRIESVVTESDLGTAEYDRAVLEERRFETRRDAMDFIASLMTDEDGIEYQPYGRVGGGSDSRYLVPTDLEILETSPHLPPPIWDDAPGFASEEQIEQMFDQLDDLPQPQLVDARAQLSWGLQKLELLRYNRVEGPALGTSLETEFGSFAGALDLNVEGFFGFADLEPKARLDLAKQSLKRRWTLSGYRTLDMVDPRVRPLDVGNTLSAFFFGRDEGEYYMATGARLSVAPAETRRASWNVQAWVERQDALANEIDFSLFHAFDDSWAFRPNVAANEIEEVAGQIELRPWWGTDPMATQFGLELLTQGGAWRETEGPDTGNYVRARAILRTAIPLASGSWRIGVEAGAGTAWGDVPVQRHWFLGNSKTLRGYPPSVASGESYGRGRLEVARVNSVGTFSLFGDGAWAGDRDRFEWDDALYTVGLGASLLDGLVRLDLSRGLKGPFKETRLDFYLDAIL